MDLWLAWHSPSPYEFFLSGDYQTGSLSTGGNFTSGNLGFTAYASLVGLQLEREFSSLAPRWLGLAHVRVYGYHYQGTHLRVELGFRQEARGNAQIWNPVVGLGTNFYFTKYVGIELLYRHAFSSASAGIEVFGDRYEGGGFLDFSFVRVSLAYARDVEVGTTPQTRSGIRAGVKLFF